MLAKTEAIVLTSIKYGEADLIVKCFTQSSGLKSYLLRNDLLNLIMEGDTNKSIVKINSFYDQGVDPSMILKDLIVVTHHSMSDE